MVESEWLVEQFVYAGSIGDGAGPFALTDAYRVAQMQVALAGRDWRGC
ncbi:hypothetical protein [Methylocystis sp. MJC1]|nr:hypothetical protein [Methylocystis sp. MJC1]